MIDVRQLGKVFTVHKKEPGLAGSIKSLVKRERIDKHAVRDATFQVGEGEIVGLIGANGAGKTTLVKMLAGIIHPSSGDATVLGHRPWERHNDFRSRIALIMGQKAQLWWDLPAADCFLLLREIYRVPEEKHRRTLEELTELLDVREQLNIQIRRLSLGERMKMELIAALLHEPRVVYLDEPTIGLDLTAQRSIREFILRYRRQHRPAMLLTSHYMEDIERLCERIIIMRGGEIVYDGGLDKVVKTYATHKIVTVHLEEGAEGQVDRERVERIGRVLESSGATLRVSVPRATVAAASSDLISITRAQDLTIEEEYIGTIIESIMRDHPGSGR
ncbi:MAG: ATP-binding cassette domain-containing protein [Candidatus Sumerlaeia bacterium]|nr:ATP-binding cassette domain-containing protein [Candidatus Sumerlaeia bacterium]